MVLPMLFVEHQKFRSQTWFFIAFLCAISFSTIFAQNHFDKWTTEQWIAAKFCVGDYANSRWVSVADDLQRIGKV